MSTTLESEALAWIDAARPAPPELLRVLRMRFEETEIRKVLRRLVMSGHVLLTDDRKLALPEHG